MDFSKGLQIVIFGRLLLNFVPKSELSYPGLHSKTILESFVPLCACYFWQMMKSMVFLNHLTLDNVIYRRVDEIRKNMDHFMHIQNGAILVKPLKVKRT